MKTLKILALTLVTVFAPTKNVVITVMALSMVDLLLGVLVSRKQGLPISSNGLRRTIIKVCLYEVAVLSAFIVGKELVGPELPVMTMVTSLIGLTELKSILENLAALQGEKDSAFAALVTKINDVASGLTKDK